MLWVHVHKYFKLLKYLNDYLNIEMEISLLYSQYDALSLTVILVLLFHMVLKKP